MRSTCGAAAGRSRRVSCMPQRTSPSARGGSTALLAACAGERRERNPLRTWSGPRWRGRRCASRTAARHRSSSPPSHRSAQGRRALRRAPCASSVRPVAVTLSSVKAGTVPTEVWRMRAGCAGGRGGNTSRLQLAAERRTKRELGRPPRVLKNLQVWKTSNQCAPPMLSSALSKVAIISDDLRAGWQGLRQLALPR